MSNRQTHASTPLFHRSADSALPPIELSSSPAASSDAFQKALRGGEDNTVTPDEAYLLESAKLLKMFRREVGRNPARVGEGTPDDEAYWSAASHLLRNRSGLDAETDAERIAGRPTATRKALTGPRDPNSLASQRLRAIDIIEKIYPSGDVPSSIRRRAHADPTQFLADAEAQGLIPEDSDLHDGDEIPSSQHARGDDFPGARRGLDRHRSGRTSSQTSHSDTSQETY